MAEATVTDETGPLVDCHAHVFDERMPMCPDAWTVPAYAFSAEDLIARLDRHGVRHAVLSGLSISGEYNDYTIRALRRYPQRLRGTAIVKAPANLYLLEQMQADGIAKEGEKGAIIVDLEAEKLGVFLALKSDGTALYSTKELALAGLKFSEYPETTQSMHVVDNRQSLYFKQFFSVLKKLGFDKPMTHISHDFVTLAEGAMSSRKGNIINVDAGNAQSFPR